MDDREPTEQLLDEVVRSERAHCAEPTQCSTREVLQCSGQSEPRATDQRRCVLSNQMEWAYRLTLGILLGCFVLWSAMRLGDFVRDDDEGINLMKARMVQEGYLLHGDIWSDQPPLFTLVLASAFDLFGASALVARGVVVAFACLGLVCTAWIARQVGGRMSSLVAVIFLALGPQFLELSRSVH